MVSPALVWADAAPHYSLIIGYNDSTDPALNPLRYADDDAIRYHELFDVVASETTLLTTLDEETRRSTPAGSRSHACQCHEGHWRYRQSHRGGCGTGVRPTFSFVFSGHGSYDGWKRIPVPLMGPLPRGTSMERSCSEHRIPNFTRD